MKRLLMLILGLAAIALHLAALIKGPTTIQAAPAATPAAATPAPRQSRDALAGVAVTNAIEWKNPLAPMGLVLTVWGYDPEKPVDPSKLQVFTPYEPIVTKTKEGWKITLGKAAQ